ncbi:MAG TPA: NAD(P)/FAD-dependent oxidoreductase [Candidatus Saccharimonadales bacterium]|nr:NAD(P)/FAD-dependent oxidoreductase [Candidatus Saccharimonadales bacterium]
MNAPDLDAVVVGAGPNGLAAAITLARAGRSVHVIEGAATIGGGTRTQELTLPGFRHDVCATVVPLTLASPFFRSIDLARHGLRILEPDAPVAHPLDGGRVTVLERSVAATAAGLSAVDGRAWRRLFGPLARDAGSLAGELLGPVPHIPRHPLALVRFGLPALQSASGLASGRFGDRRPEPCSRASPRTPCWTCGGRSRPPSASSWGCTHTPWAGRSSAVARRT